MSGLKGGNQTYSFVGRFDTTDTQASPAAVNWKNDQNNFQVTNGKGTSGKVTVTAATGATAFDLDFILTKSGSWDRPWYYLDGTTDPQFGISDNGYDSLTNYYVEVPYDNKDHAISIAYDATSNFPIVKVDGATPTNITTGAAGRPKTVTRYDAQGNTLTETFALDSNYNVSKWSRSYGYSPYGNGRKLYVAEWGLPTISSPSTSLVGHSFLGLYFGALPSSTEISYNATGRITQVSDKFKASDIPTSAANPVTWIPGAAGTYMDFDGWNYVDDHAATSYWRPASWTNAFTINSISPTYTVIQANTFDANGADVLPLLQSASLGEGLKLVGNAAFAKQTALNSVTFPASLEEIGDNAFAGASGLSSISFALSSQLLTVDGAAFAGTSLTTPVTIPDSVVYIGGNAFNDAGLTSITLGSGLKYIAGGAFSGNPNLTTVTMSAPVPPKLADPGNTFNGASASGLTIQVPSGTASDYIAAGYQQAGTTVQ